MPEIEYFIGGGADKNDLLSEIVGSSGVMKRVMRSRVKTPTLQVEYRGHEQEDLILSQIILKVKADPSLVVNITGHSWGGQTAIRVTTKLARVGISVNELITLDPVSLTYMSEPTPYVWVNVYQDQTILDYIATVPVVGNAVSSLVSAAGAVFPGDTTFDDTVATTGGQLGAQPGAINISTSLHHVEALEMYNVARRRLTTNQAATAVRQGQSK